MLIQIDLFGALRDVAPDSRLAMETGARTIAELRAELDAIAAGWPASSRALLSRSAFASATTILRDADVLPDNGHLALLPPVSGG